MLTLLFSLRDCFRARAFLQAEILALRHQLLVLQRSNRGHKLRLGWADRVLWVWLSRLWNDWRSALLLVKPETVIAWHRKGFRLYWRWKSRCCEGRPTVSSKVRNLIRHMSLANPRWGSPRIHGELEQALLEYEAELKVSPNRFNSLYGAGRAAELAKQPNKAMGFYGQLMKVCAGGNSNRPEIVHAQAFISR